MTTMAYNIVRGLAAVLRDRGISDDAFLTEAQLSREVLERAYGFEDVDQVSRAIRAAYRLSKEPALGLMVGRSVPPHMFSVAGQLLIASPNLRSAIEDLERFLPLLMPMARVHLREQGAVAALEFELPESHRESYRFAVEVALAFVLRVGRQFISRRVSPKEVRMRHGDPGYRALYEEMFGCPIAFSAERDEILFDASFLDVQQPFADDQLRHIMLRRAEDLLSALRVREPVQRRVRHVLMREPRLDDVELSSIARRIGMSPRALRRRLRSEGVLLSCLVDDLRREVAFYELLHTTTPIKQIADRVGFSEVSAFHRAFKRWTGVTPAKYRAEHGFAQAS